MGLLEFKYIKRSVEPTKEKIESLVQDAKEQLERYQQDELVMGYLDDGLMLQNVILVFWGWEMVYCEKITPSKH